MFSISKDNGIGLLDDPVPFSSIRPVHFTCEAPEEIHRGESVGIRCMIMNRSPYELETYIILKGKQCKLCTSKGRKEAAAAAKSNTWSKQHKLQEESFPSSSSTVLTCLPENVVDVVAALCRRRPAVTGSFFYQSAETRDRIDLRDTAQKSSKF